MDRETNLLRSERGDKRNPTSSERDGQRGRAGEDGPVTNSPSGTLKSSPKCYISVYFPVISQ